MGKYMSDQGLTDVYVMAPNYAAGKDMVTGFKRYFKGKIVDEVYTKLGQADYQAEISQLRAKNPKAVFVFYPGGIAEVDAESMNSDAEGAIAGTAVDAGAAGRAHVPLGTQGDVHYAISNILCRDPGRTLPAHEHDRDPAAPAQ